METLTWDKFKELVDKKLEELGEDGSIEIYYIDVNKPDEYIGVCIFRDGLLIE